MYKKLPIFFLIVILAACVPQNQPALQVEPSSIPIQPVQTDPAPVATFTETPLPTATSIPLPNVPEEYLPYTIDYLRSRPYGGGQIELLEVMEEQGAFTRYLIRYPSDGLNIYGFVNVPKGDGPFPVMIVIHGYVEASAYEILDYTTDAADGFANAGYLVFHPNMRGYPPSDNGDNLFRVGLAVDILNLIALIKEPGSQPGLLENADSTHIGLWSHSLGGGVALRVATVSQDIDAVLLYAAVSGDDQKNAELFYTLTGEQINLTEMDTPPEVMQYISPIYYFDKITAPIKLYHGTADEAVPVAWAVETCDTMRMDSVNVDCVYYIDGKHTFFSKFQPEFNNSVFAFFDMYLMQP